MSKHKEIIKILEEKLCNLKLVDRKLMKITNYLQGGYYKLAAEKFINDIAIAIEKIYDIKYLDRMEATEILEDYEDAIGVIYVDIDSRITPKTEETLEELEARKEIVFDKTIDSILKLAIPDKDKEIEELKSDLDYNGKQATKQVKEIDKLKAHIKEQIKIHDNHVDEIDKRGRKIDKLKAEIDRLKKGVFQRRMNLALECEKCGNINHYIMDEEHLIDLDTEPMPDKIESEGSFTAPEDGYYSFDGKKWKLNRKE